MTISNINLESPIKQHPLVSEGLLRRMVDVNLNYFPEATAQQWLGVANELKLNPVANMVGWGITWLFLDETADPANFNPHNRLVTSLEIAQGMDSGMLPWKKMIPRYTPLFEALRSNRTKLELAYFDDFERSPSRAAQMVYGKPDYEWALMRSGYNALIQLFRYFDQEPSAIVGAGVSAGPTSWAKPIPCVTSHCWWGSAKFFPGCLVNISLEDLGSAIVGLAQCAALPFEVSINLYTEPQWATKLNSPELRAMLRFVKGLS